MGETIVDIPGQPWFKDKPIKLTFPEGWRVQRSKMSCEGQKGLTKTQVKRAIRNAIGTKSLNKLAKDRREAVIIFEGTLLDRSCAQVVVKQKKDCREFDIITSDQIVSFAFSYYYGEKEKDESASDQIFLDKKVFNDGNLMVAFGIFSESKKKDVQTTAIYRYYYCPIEEKRIYAHVKHEMLKEAIVQGIDNIDGRFGSLISLKSRSAVVESLNFGEIYPYLNFHSYKEKIEQYQLNQNPSTKEREWIISYQNDATLGSEAWLLNAVVGFGLEGFAHQVSRSLSSALDQRPTLITALPVHEALNRINRGELGEEYAAMVADYVRTGILNRAGLQKIGQAIHANYVFQPSLASFNQSMSGRFSFFGLRVLQTRTTMLRMSVQLWDTRTGEIVWESSGEATLAGEDVREFRIPFDEIARRLWANMLDDLFKDVPVE